MRHYQITKPNQANTPFRAGRRWELILVNEESSPTSIFDCAQSATLTLEANMPLFLESRVSIGELKHFGSVLIVSCPICPPISVSIQQEQPFIELFKHGLRSDAFERHIKLIQNSLEKHGVRTDAFTMRLPVPMMCLWTGGQRQRLLRRARDFEAVLVLGCDSATYTALEALRDTGCEVFQGMTVKTITNATAKFRFPGRVELQLHPLPTKPKIGGLDPPAGDIPRSFMDPE